MTTSVELHDSNLDAITRDGASVVLTFSPAYIHCSEGCPGVDAGTGWSQVATLTFSDASISSSANLPRAVADGWLRVGHVLHENLIPADGVFDAPCELHLILCGDSGPLVIHGTRLTVALRGKPLFVEEVGSFAAGDL